jgi:dTDP-4-amino-4,6-dideoxygalactose transaminase
MINFLNIQKNDKTLKKKIVESFEQIISKSDFINGDQVKKFESNFKNFIKSKYCITVGNGTDALIIALKSLDLKKNAEVIVPAMTWKSTALAPLNLGLKLKLVDVEKKSANYDISKLKKAINSKTKVIIVVHLYGNPANLKEIKKIIKNKKIFLIEDAAQAHGAFDYKLKKRIGSIGDMACFSFYPGKNLGAYGDAGCITLNNSRLAKKIYLIKNMGSLDKYDCETIGLNSRLDTIQAAILNLKLKHLNNRNEKRVKLAKIYNKEIHNEKITKIEYCNGCVFHQYVILSKYKKKIINLLKKNNIQYSEHYPISINKLKIFSKNKSKKFKNAENFAKYGLSLPIDPTLKKNDILKISKLINTI